ncbi:MAG: hypothetical protein H6Q42_1792 [Deltaproteobacteria bacterium]|jgi:hypothetical protein|nr:hypothetical protein [Deltaproteobacteria bacterium]
MGMKRPGQPPLAWVKEIFHYGMGLEAPIRIKTKSENSKREDSLKGIRRPKTPCGNCLNDLQARQETKGYVLLYCSHNRAGLITSMEEGEGQTLDVVISPVDEKQFRKTVVSVLLNSVLEESRRMDRILEFCDVEGKLGLG